MPVEPFHQTGSQSTDLFCYKSYRYSVMLLLDVFRFADTSYGQAKVWKRQPCLYQQVFIMVWFQTFLFRVQNSHISQELPLSLLILFLFFAGSAK